jgi:hypothetical protein
MMKLAVYQIEAPQPLVQDTPEGAPYPVHALGPLKDAVEAVHAMTQAPIAIPAQSALAIASLAVQGFANVEALGGQSPLSLYCLTVARSGERKSSCDAKLMASLRTYEREQAAELGAGMQSWQNKHALWRGERESVLNEAKKSKGEKRVAAQADLSALGSEPAAPPAPDRTVTEPTFEGLTRKYTEGMPSLGIFSDEGGQFLGGYAMSADNRQKTLTALNDLWQGNPIRRTRQGDGSLTLYDRRLAIHLMAQPGVARPFLTDGTAIDTGFLARFLICEPPSTIGLRTYVALPYPTGLSQYDARLTAILRTPLPMDPETRELNTRDLPLSLDARDLLINFANTTEHKQGHGQPYADITGTASKAAEQAARIAGVLTLFRDLNAACVALEDVANAVELMSYYLDEALRLSQSAALSGDLERAEKLRRWIIDTWPHDEILPRDIQKNGPTTALRQAPKVRSAIAILEKYGWLIPFPPGEIIRGAARREAWRVVRG